MILDRRQIDTAGNTETLMGLCHGVGRGNRMGRLYLVLRLDTEGGAGRCQMRILVPVFWGLGTVVFRVVGTGPRGASARTVSLSRQVSIHGGASMRSVKHYETHIV